MNDYRARVGGYETLNKPMITIFPGNTVLLIPPEMLGEFKEVIRRGMSFEHGESPAMHQFADAVAQIVTPSTPPSVTPETSGNFNS